MPRFFVRQERVTQNQISIIGDDAHHIARSLRMAVGEKITVCDMQGNEYDCEIASFDEDREVIATIISKKEASNEPACCVTLFQALPKGDKFDTIIQKAVECGVSKIVPFQSERCVVRIKDEAESRKTQRRQRISAEAAKQCGRSVIPDVIDSVTFAQALDIAKDSADVCLFCYEGAGTEPLGRVLRGMENDFPKRVAVFVGSEGGFSQKEANVARDMGMKMIGLGKRILRTETASGFVLACIAFSSELL